MWLVAAVLSNIDLDPALNMLNSETWSIFLALSGKMRCTVQEPRKRLSGIETEVWGQLHLE